MNSYEKFQEHLLGKINISLIIWHWKFDIKFRNNAKKALISDLNSA